MKIHTGAKSDLCNKTFAQQTILNNHIQIKEGEKSVENELTRILDAIEIAETAIIREVPYEPSSFFSSLELELSTISGDKSFFNPFENNPY